jgi:hypothetical protein
MSARISPLNSIPRGYLRYHGVFRQGKRGKTSPARTIARIIRDGFVAKSLSRVVRPAREALRTRCVLVQYGEGPRGKPAGRRLVVTAGRRLQQKRS